MQNLHFYYEIDESAGLGINRETGKGAHAYIALSFQVLYPFKTGVYQELHEQKIPAHLMKENGWTREQIRPISEREYREMADV